MTIRIGMNLLLWATQIGVEHIPVVTALAEAGFDGVEIPIGGQSKAELDAMAAACDSLGLARTASAFVGLEHNPISPDPAIRHAAIVNLQSAVDSAHWLGADRVIGGLYQAHKYFTGAAATEQEWSWSAECLRAVADHAAQYDMHLALEFLNRFEAFLVNTSEDCKRLVNLIDRPNVGVLYDTHHANIEDPEPESALASIAETITHVHFSESHRGTLGSGQVDWQATIAGLRDIHYDGWIVIEAFGSEDPVLALAANVWRNAFESREQLYQQGLQFVREQLIV